MRERVIPVKGQCHASDTDIRNVSVSPNILNNQNNDSLHNYVHNSFNRQSFSTLQDQVLVFCFEIEK